MKIINKEKARKDPYVYKNLRREGRLLQRGHHKHVISIYDTLGKFLGSAKFWRPNFSSYSKLNRMKFHAHIPQILNIPSTLY